MRLAFPHSVLCIEGGAWLSDGKTTFYHEDEALNKVRCKSFLVQAEG